VEVRRHTHTLSPQCSHLLTRFSIPGSIFGTPAVPRQRHEDGVWALARYVPDLKAKLERLVREQLEEDVYPSVKPMPPRYVGADTARPTIGLSLPDQWRRGIAGQTSLRLVP
jgi:hypothetical protein